MSNLSGRGLLAAALTLALAAPVAAQRQPTALSLDEALRRAADGSESVVIARAEVTRARGTVLQAESARLPQLNSSASYQRTLASQFEGLAGPAPVVPPVCQQPVDPTLPLNERLAFLEQRLDCPPGGGFDIGSAGFGSENTYNLGLSFALPLYTGGRLPAQRRAARAGRDIAEIGVTSAEASLRLEVTQAYFDAQLADQLVSIAQTQISQADEALRLAELGQRVGTQAEFDVLRARVARDNLVPQRVQAEANRDIAYDRLRLLLDVPLDEPLALTTPLSEVDRADGVISAEALAATRAPVRQAEAGVRTQQAQVAIARSQRLPNLSLSSQYGLVAFPQDILPNRDQFRDNWTVTAAVQVPVFTGGRIRGEVLSARAGLTQAEAQLEQAREAALLDTRSALAQLTAARATVQAVSATVEQAERAYQIAELRYREGLSTLLELNETRLQLAQARTQRASALRDLQVAETRVELLPYLPLSVGGGAQQQQGTQQQQRPQQQPQSQQGQQQGQGQAGGQTGAFTGAGVP